MFKGILKMIAGGIMCLAMPAAIISGIVIGTTANVGEKREEKEALLDKYRLTQEFKDERTAQSQKYLEALNQGYITPNEYIEKLEELESVSYAESKIIENGNQEFLLQLSEINKKIEKAQEQENNGFLLGFLGGLGGTFVSVGGSLLVPVGYKEFQREKQMKKNAQQTSRTKKFKKDDERIIDI